MAEERQENLGFTEPGGLAGIASSLQNYVSSNTPVDIIVGEFAAGQDPSSTVTKIAAVDGVEYATPLPWLDVKMTNEVLDDVEAGKFDVGETHEKQ